MGQAANTSIAGLYNITTIMRHRTYEGLIGPCDRPIEGLTGYVHVIITLASCISTANALYYAANAKCMRIKGKFGQ